MSPPAAIRKVMRRSPPRTKMVGGIRRVQRRSILANSNQVDMLQKVRLLLHKPSGLSTDQEASEEEKRSSSRLRVAVRVRPLNSHETKVNSREIVVAAGPQLLVFDPPVDHQEFFFHNKKQKDITAKKYKDQKFAFDYVYDNQITNDKIYVDVISPLLSTLMTGVNCSVFAYGATGSGKTYTMLGTPQNPGLTYLAMNDLYNRLEEASEQFDYQLVVSYFEVYNEQVRDLLNYTGEQLQVREIGTGIDIGNLSYHHPRDVTHLMEMLRTGNSHRSQHPTDHNAESSRSHALLQVQIKLRERHSSMNTTSRSAKIVMVDLAGSEKGTATGYTGQRFREGSSINKSLLALGNCISALATGKKFIQFRDSKLTRILKDSLGGNCKTVMVANVSPAQSLYDDTLNTLRYAEKAKKISCKAKKNVMTVQSCLSQYTRVVDEMAEKIESLENENREKDTCISNLREELVQSTEYAYSVQSQLEEIQTKILQQQGVAVTTQGLIPPSADSAQQLAPSVDNVKQLPPVPAVPHSTRSLDSIGPMKAFFHVVKAESLRKRQIWKAIENCIYHIELSNKRLSKYEKTYRSTKDYRFEKAAKKVQRKISLLLKKLELSLTKMTTLLGSIEKTDYTHEPSSKHLNYTEMWRSLRQTLPPGQVPKVLMMPPEDALCSLLKQKRGEELATENGIIKSQLANLMMRCDEKDELLTDAVNLTNRLYTLVKHYEHDTPTLNDLYENFISTFCGTSVHFADGSEEDLEDDKLSDTVLSQEYPDVGNDLVCENPAQFFQSIMGRVSKSWKSSDETSTNQFHAIIREQQEQANTLVSFDDEHSTTTLPSSSSSTTLPSTSGEMNLQRSEELAALPSSTSSKGILKTSDQFTLKPLSSVTMSDTLHEPMDEDAGVLSSSTWTSAAEQRALNLPLSVNFPSTSGQLHSVREEPMDGLLDSDLDPIIMNHDLLAQNLPPLEALQLPFGPGVAEAGRLKFMDPNLLAVAERTQMQPQEPLNATVSQPATVMMQPEPFQVNLTDAPIPHSFMMPSQRLNRMEADSTLDTHSVPEEFLGPSVNLNVTTTVSRFDGTFIVPADEESMENQSPEGGAIMEAPSGDTTVILSRASEGDKSAGGARKRGVEGVLGQPKAAKYAKKTPYTTQLKKMSPKLLKIVKRAETSKSRSQPLPLKISAKPGPSSCSRLPKRSPNSSGFKKPKYTPSSSSVGGNLPRVINPIEMVPAGPAGEVGTKTNENIKEEGGNGINKFSKE